MHVNETPVNTDGRRGRWAGHREQRRSELTDAAIERLDHCSIRTTKLAETQRFYETVMGFAPGPRPPFPFPGVWLYKGERLVPRIGREEDYRTPRRAPARA